MELPCGDSRGYTSPAVVTLQQSKALPMNPEIIDVTENANLVALDRLPTVTTGILAHAWCHDQLNAYV